MQQWGRAPAHRSHPSTGQVTAGEEGAWRGRGLRVARGLGGGAWSGSQGLHEAEKASFPSCVLTFTFLGASCTPLGALVSLTVGVKKSNRL